MSHLGRADSLPLLGLTTFVTPSALPPHNVQTQRSHNENISFCQTYCSFMATNSVLLLRTVLDTADDTMADESKAVLSPPIVLRHPHLKERMKRWVESGALTTHHY